MKKIYTALGLMSGTSMDGIDASIIKSDGETEYKTISNKYFEYEKDLYENLIILRDRINSSKDLKKFENELKTLEKEITLYHAKVVNNLINDANIDIDFVGFHGQTIFHNAVEKITVQLGDGKLLSQLTKKKVVYDFRQNDLKNDGQGAPLTPIFHKMLEKKFNLKPVSFINIGGILNRSTIWEDGTLTATDIGPGMCLVDKWIRTNSKQKYDIDGELGNSGKINKIILNQALDNFFGDTDYYMSENKYTKSFDVSDFNFLFVKGLSLEDGAATLIEYTVKIILAEFNFTSGYNKKKKIILCGGGRKNQFLIERIKRNHIELKLIDDYGIDGDFIESQAFGYLAIRSYLGLPISFPNTTGCKEVCTGGVLTENF